MTDRSVVVRLRLNIRDFSQGATEAAAEAKVLSHELEGVDKRMGSVEKSSNGAGREIDKLSGRIALLGHLAAAVGPALVPIGAVGVPVIAGLSTELGFAVLAGGSLIGAMQGVGTAVKALEKARLDPTTTNLQAAQLAMEKLGPDAQNFALHLQATLPMLHRLQNSATSGWFPGLTDAIDTLTTRGPQVAGIIEKISRAGGKLASEGADALAGHEWDDFFNFLEHEGPKAVSELGHSVGSLTHGLAELWMAMNPLSSDFTAGLEKNAARFDDWATKLDGTRGYQEFIDYIRETGPEVLDFLGSTANMLLQIVEAAAPLGGPTLQILTDVADVIAKIADSNLGTPLLGLASLAGTLKLLERAAGGIGPKFTGASNSVKQFGKDAHLWSFGAYDDMERMNAAGKRVGKTVLGLGKTGAIMGGIALAASGATDSVGLTNTTLLGMSGLMLGPFGAAIGTGIGFLMDLGDAADNTDAALGRLSATIGSNDLAELERLRAELQGKANSWQGLLNWKGSGDAARSGVSALDEAISNLDNGQRVKGLGYLFRTTLSSGIDHANQSLKEFENTFLALDNLLQRRGSLIAYEQALDDMAKSIKDNGNAWSATTEKGRGNLTAASTLTTQAIARADLLKKQGDSEGAARVLGRAITDLKDFAGSSKAADKALEPLIRHLEKINHIHAKPKLDADGLPLKGKTKDAERDLDHVDKKRPKPKLDADHRILMGKVHQGDQWLIALNNRKATPHFGADDSELKGKVQDGTSLIHRLNAMKATPKVNADAHGLFSVFAAVRGAIANLNGSTATTYVRTVRQGGMGPQMAEGGTIPGVRSPYGDKTLILAAPGEELITNRNGQADAFRADRAAGRIPAYAYGGTVGPTRWDSGRHHMAGSRHVVERIVERLPRGPVNAHIHGFGDVALEFVENIADDRITAHSLREEEQAGL